ncbi:hypothetical protein D3C72_2235360 [compost metagenome]
MCLRNVEGGAGGDDITGFHAEIIAAGVRIPVRAPAATIVEANHLSGPCSILRQVQRQLVEIPGVA